jgi:PIN domain nuclease of toxin-antitoxin system
VWELAIKVAIGKMRSPGDLPVQIAHHRFDPLAVTVDHAVWAGGLPLHHGDPFDRMLIAQAQLEGLTIVTRDSRFAAYDVALLPA